MVKLTESLKQWMLKRHPEILPLLLFGHVELFTSDMWRDYIEWCKTEEGEQYLEGGAKYRPSQ